MSNDAKYKELLLAAWSDDSEAEESVRELYLDWVNNFLTVDRFCEYHELEKVQIGRAVINLGRILHEEYCTEQHKKRMAK